MNDYTFYREFAGNFLSGEYNQFIFSGNIYDVYTINDHYYSLSEFLFKKLSTSRIVVKYSLSSGIEFSNNDERDKFIDILSANLSFFETKEEKQSWVIKNIAHSRISVIEALKIMKEASKIHFHDKTNVSHVRPFAFLIEHAETIIPAGQIMHMNEQDRQKLVFFRDWLNDHQFINSRDLIIFISQTRSEIHKSIINLPSINHILIQYPDFTARKMFIEHHLSKLKITSDISLKRASELTAGLTLSGIKHILLQTHYTNSALNEENIIGKTEEVIRGTIGDYIRIKHPVHRFDQIIGARKIKDELKRQIKIIRLQDAAVIPHGYLVSGRNGVGKTYIMEAFAGELGWLCIELKNLRQKYLGETDIIFERIKDVLESFQNVMVFIDEADTMFGGRGEFVHETEKRLTGNFIKMIGDPDNRGRIIWVFITSRPDLLLPDFIRRLEIKIGFFNPTGEDRLDFIKSILAQVPINYETLSESDKNDITLCFKDFSPAEFQTITTQIIAESRLHPDLSITGIIRFLKRFNSTINKDKYVLQDELAEKYSTFIDLIE